MLEDLFKDTEKLDFHNPDDFKKYVNTIIDLKDSCKDTIFESVIDTFADEAYKVGYKMYQECQDEIQKEKTPSKEEIAYNERLKKISSDGLDDASVRRINKLVNEYVETILKPNMKYNNHDVKNIDAISVELRSLLIWMLKNK